MLARLCLTVFICVQFRQRTGKNDVNFKATGNDRCTETFREASGFAEQLKEIRRTIKALRAATEGKDLHGRRL